MPSTRSLVLFTGSCAALAAAIVTASFVCYSRDTVAGSPAGDSAAAVKRSAGAGRRTPDDARAEKAAAERRTRDDLKRLAGEWEVVDWQCRGKQFRPAIGRRYTFDGERLKVVRPNGVSVGFTVKVDASQTPGAIDVRHELFAQLSRPAIYRFQGDRLEICQSAMNVKANLGAGTVSTSTTDSDRPKQFSGDGEDNLIVLKRVGNGRERLQ